MVVVKKQSNVVDIKPVVVEVPPHSFIVNELEAMLHPGNIAKVMEMVAALASNPAYQVQVQEAIAKVMASQSVDTVTGTEVPVTVIVAEAAEVQSDVVDQPVSAMAKALQDAGLNVRPLADPKPGFLDQQ